MQKLRLSDSELIKRTALVYFKRKEWQIYNPKQRERNSIYSFREMEQTGVDRGKVWDFFRNDLRTESLIIQLGRASPGMERQH